MPNYFNSLTLREQLGQLGQCRFMEKSEFANGAKHLQDKKIVIVGCGSQGLNQGLCLRDSGLDVSYALRDEAISGQRASWRAATEQRFAVGGYEEMVPSADIVLNLTPDKQHGPVVSRVMPLMKPNSTLGYSHGLNIVEEGQSVRADITVVMVAPKCPGTEVRNEFLRDFGVPTLIAVHPENNPQGNGLEIAKALAAGIGSDRAGVLESSFVAEVKSDLMGEQTILCGMLQAGSMLCWERMAQCGVPAGHAAKLLQHGWETIAEGLKHGGITHMMDRLSNPAKIRAFHLSAELKDLLRDLCEQHMDAIMDGRFSTRLMADWGDDDRELHAGRARTAECGFEKTEPTDEEITEQEYYDRGILMVAMLKAGAELAFETMRAAGMAAESAYYESLHEVPLIANLIGRHKLAEMNLVISDTAEYGCYLFADACVPLLSEFMESVDEEVIGAGLQSDGNGVDNQELIAVNAAIRSHPIETIGRQLRRHMTAMKRAI